AAQRSPRRRCRTPPAAAAALIPLLPHFRRSRVEIEGPRPSALSLRHPRRSPAGHLCGVACDARARPAEEVRRSSMAGEGAKLTSRHKVLDARATEANAYVPRRPAMPRLSHVACASERRVSPAVKADGRA
ncbi:unnamed protein product, partial [Urochloa humidicola]